MAKILHLTSTLASAGAETMMVSLITTDKNNEHVVCSIYAGGIYQKKLEEIGIQTRSLNIGHKIFIPFAFVKFFFVVLKENPQIIHSYLFLDNVIARIIGKLLLKKVICSKRDSDRQKPWFVHFLNRLTGWLANITVTNFTDGIEELKYDGISERKIKYIANGKKIENYEITKKKEEVRKELGFNPNQIIITFTGRLVWYKGQEYLIKAFELVHTQYPHTLLILVGSGNKEKELKKLVQTLHLENAVRFLGARNDISLILKATDIFVSPSLRDGMPGVIMEAMASGLPVIATNADGSKDLIKDNVNGLLVPVKNSSLITQKIIDLIKDKKKTRELGENAKKTIAQEFTVEEMVEKYTNLYTVLIGK